MIRVLVLYFRYSLECNIPENQLPGGVHENVRGLTTTTECTQSRYEHITVILPLQNHCGVIGNCYSHCRDEKTKAQRLNTLYAHRQGRHRTQTPNL